MRPKTRSLFIIAALLGLFSHQVHAAAITLKTNDTTNVTKFPNDSTWPMQPGAYYSTQQYFRNDNSATSYIQYRFLGLTSGVPHSVGEVSKESAVNRSSVTKFVALDSDGTTILATRYIDQKYAPDAFAYDGVNWRGLFNVTPTGTTLYVRMYAENGGTANYVIADGMYVQPWSDGLGSAVPFSIADGNFASQSTWFSGVVPSTSNALTNFYTYVNVAANASIGTSGASGAFAASVKRDSGKIIVKGGIQLAQAQATPLRTVGYYPVQVGTGATGGAILEIDASGSSGSASVYTITQSGSNQPNSVVRGLGVLGNTSILRSNAGGAAFNFPTPITAGNSIEGDFFTLDKIGTSAVNACNPVLPNAANNAFILRDSIANNCGRISVSSTGAASSLVVQRTRFTNSAGTTAASFPSTTPSGGAVRLIDNNRFDKFMSMTPVTGATVTNNHFDGNYQVNAFDPAAWSNNLVVASTGVASAPNTSVDDYLYSATSENNPHPINVPSINSSYSGLIFDMPAGTNGDMILGGSGSQTIAATGNIILPNSLGTSPGELISPVGGAGVWTVDRNTVTSTYANQPNAETGLGVFGETAPGTSGMFASWKSNLLWSPSGTGAFLIRHNTNFIGDIFPSPSAADYNAGNALQSTTSGTAVLAVSGPQGGYNDNANAGVMSLWTRGAAAGAFTLDCYGSDGVMKATTASIAYNATAATAATAIQAALNTLGDGTYVVTSASPSTLLNFSAGGVGFNTFTRNGVAVTYAQRMITLRPTATNTTGVTIYVSRPMFTSTTGLGAHDITANPAFVDPTRNLATFDSVYLGNTRTAWADATVYAVGDERSSTDAGFYGGATVNYRCIAAHTSAIAHATNGKPGAATLWRSNWEFAAIHRIRSATVVYDSGVAQATPKDLHTWVKNGFAPTNAALATAAHDGGTIGAVPYFSAGAALSPITGPTTGEVAKDSDNFTVTLTGTVTGTVTFTPTAPATTFTPAALALTNGSKVGTFKANRTDYGDATISVANDGGFATQTLSYHAKIQAGVAIIGTPTPGLDWGGWLPNATGKLGILTQDVTALPKDAKSDAMMAFWGATFGSNRKVNFDQINQAYGRSYSVVTNDTPMVPVIVGLYKTESDCEQVTWIGYAPLLDNPGVGGNATVPTAPPSGDGHAIAFNRDTKKCYVAYRAWRDPANGNAWNCASLTVWDFSSGSGGYEVGATPPQLPSSASLRRMGHTSETAAGLPIFSQVLRYDEAIRGPIQKCVRITTGTTGNAPSFVWPARHQAGGGSSQGVPFGARLRLRQDWYDANKATFGETGVGPSHIPANILWGFRNRGVISTDHTSSSVHFQPEIGLSTGWANYAGLEAFMEQIPATGDAWEVVEMTPGVSLSASRTSGYPGEPVTLTATYPPAALGDDNFGASWYFSTTNGTTIRTANVVQSNLSINPAAPGNTSTWTPQAGDIGTHQLSVRDIAGNYKADPVTYTVLNPALDGAFIPGTGGGVLNNPVINNKRVK